MAFALGALLLAACAQAPSGPDAAARLRVAPVDRDAAPEGPWPAGFVRERPFLSVSPEAAVLAATGASGTSAQQVVRAFARARAADLDALVASSDVIAIASGWSTAAADGEGRRPAYAREPVVYLRDKRGARRPELLQVRGPADVLDEVLREPWPLVFFLDRVPGEEGFVALTDPATCCLWASPERVEQVKARIRRR